ncbi:hypothetical protein [Rubrivirga sp.]|uniref:hypothetical protein n=1 Tax=Rubrivirga sp. TaxID=1885344 RepID=UPI003B5200F2
MRLALLLAVLLSGCSLFGGDPAEIGFGVETPAPLTAEIRLRGRPVPLRDDQPTTSGTLLYAEPAETAAGPATVACTVSSGTASTTGTLDLDLEAGWRYHVFCAASATDPADLCFGCRGSTSVALDPAFGLPADHRLWLVWGGDSVDNPVLY